MGTPAKQFVMDPKIVAPFADEKSEDISENLSSDEEYSDDDDNAPNEEIQINFEGRTAEVSDLNGIRNLLQQLFLKDRVNTSDLADIILQQNYIGSVIKQSELPEDDDSDDDDFVLAVTSVINITKDTEKECVGQIKDLLSKQCQKHGSDETVRLFIEALQRPKHSAAHVGFMINERIVNTPPQLSAPLLESLRDEVKSAEIRPTPFIFDRFIMICKYFKADGENAEVVYSKPEDEVFHRECLTSFSYGISGESDTALEGIWKTKDEGLKPYRLVIMFTLDKFNAIVTKIKAEFAS